MVKCFLIHTLCPVSTLSAKESRILYCRVFEPMDQLSGMNTDIIPEEKRLLEKEKLATIARQVQSTCSLWREARGQPSVEPVLGEEARALEEADSGMLLLPAGDPFPEEHFLLWLGVHALGFSMVCQADDNLLLAEGALRSLASHCLESLRLLAPGSEVLLKSDRIEALLHHLVPHGQLLFINHRFAQSLDKELTACMAK